MLYLVARVSGFSVSPLAFLILCTLVSESLWKLFPQIPLLVAFLLSSINGRHGQVIGRLGREGRTSRFLTTCSGASGRVELPCEAVGSGSVCLQRRQQQWAFEGGAGPRGPGGAWAVEGFSAASEAHSRFWQHRFLLPPYGPGDPCSYWVWSGPISWMPQLLPRCWW